MNNDEMKRIFGACAVWYALDQNPLPALRKAGFSVGYMATEGCRYSLFWGCGGIGDAWDNAHLTVWDLDKVPAGEHPTAHPEAEIFRSAPRWELVGDVTE